MCIATTERWRDAQRHDLTPSLVTPSLVTPSSRDTVTLPDQEAGLLMVFRAFERVSFGLVLYATDVMNVFDKVRNP